MRIFVLGHRGMLGRYVHKYLGSIGYEVIGVARPTLDASKATRASLMCAAIHSKDVIVNCVGIIKQRSDVTKSDYVLVNSAFPHLLQETCENIGCRLIHVTTDCVFDGLDGNYNENSVHNAKDIYGMSKSLGEPEEATVIRTSIIGEEVGQTRSLVEWVKSNKGKQINGYTNHMWNGITCLEFAKLCDYIIKNNIFWRGVKNITSPESVSKYDLVKMISDIYGLDLSVLPMDTEEKCDRTLGSIRDDVTIEVPHLKDQIKEMREFYINLC